MSYIWLIDNKKSLDMVQGEDRSPEIRIMDENFRPIDLTGAEIKLELPKKDGTKVIRSNTGIAFLDAAISTALNQISVPDHGLVSGDSFQLSSSGVLPAGLALLTTYYAKVVDKDTLELSLTLNGASVDITAATGGGTHTIAYTPLSVTGNAVLGTVTPILSDLASAEFKADEKQTMELHYTIGSITRVVRMIDALNVEAQTL